MNGFYIFMEAQKIAAYQFQEPVITLHNSDYWLKNIKHLQ
jgi:hypothetical protein